MLLITLAIAVTATAQTAQDEIKANKFLAGSNYLDYDNHPATKALTPAPEGYVPYLMNHYGRHGSRWLINERSYTRPINMLTKAKEQGKLTTTGEQVLSQIQAVYATSTDRLGDLSTVGERQHHGIGKRMAQNFPEIFKKDGVPIDARSTVVNRCILSMIAECEELAAANPTARFHNDVSEALQYYLNQPHSKFLKDVRKAANKEVREIEKSIAAGCKTDRIMAQLFNDTKWAADSIDAYDLVYKIFDICTNMQSHELDLNLYPLFTDEEIYRQWRVRNVQWYMNYGASPVTKSLMPFSQENLLKDIIQVADTTKTTAAVLRFGHEVCVMPLACLLELDSCGMKTYDNEYLEKYWRNYNIFPMGCNVQLVFYKPVNGKGDILVKALLNEREASLPVKTKQFPYYKWKDLRKYYTDKLQWFEEQKKKAEN